MSKPKVLVIHHKLGFIGGAEQNIYFMTDYMRKDFDFSILYSELANQPETFSKNFIHKIHESQVSEILKEEKFDLIYMHKCLNVPLFQMLLQSKIPIVHMVHDHEIYCLRKYKYFPLSRKICKHKASLCCLCPGFAFIERDDQGHFQWRNPHYFEHKKLVQLDQQCRMILVGSNYMRDELIHQGYDLSLISIIPPVIPSPKKTIIPSFSDKNILLFVGQVIKGKGLDCLIQALSNVRLPFRLIVMGEGNHLAYCQKLTQELGLEEKIEFKGYVSHETLEDYFSEASVGIVPSVWPEPFGMVGLEFMQASLPVIGFNSGGIADWLKDGLTGYLIPWMDIQKMSTRIEHLLSNKEEAKQLGNNGRQFVNSHFNFEFFCEKLISNFWNCLSF